ncbi:hypothetical protein SLS56_010350 [Neofusicoccum ribis]|uniref:Heterokaryon incompatibility domain-containing protein n=1 Tax=Neofusicoccum ribis TaxID=45134 RepID=A0ABR3SEM7_9PEZI
MLYSHLPGSSIRLLDVICADDEVAYRLRSFSLSSTPTFDAVSYAWGREGRTETIFCNNEPVQVTPALKAMLKHIFHHRPSPDHLELEQTFGVSLRPLWIDAICINQNDPQEREAQIRLISSVFARATRVIIWLGPEGRHTDSFMYEASTVVQALERRSLTCPFHWEQPTFGTLEHRLQSVWMGLQEILQREWQNRLWTFQEAVLAKHAVVVCGRYSVDLNVVTKIDRLLENGPFDINSFMQEQRQNRELPYIFPFKDIGLFRDLVTQNNNNNSSPRFGVPWLLSQGYREGAKQPVDRIWSFLGLLEKRLQAEIMPILNYHDHGWRTYMRLTKILLKYDTRFDLLSLSTHVPGEMAEKPSWCIDLAAPMPYRTFYFMRDNYRAGISKQLSRWNCHSQQTRIPNVYDDEDKILEVPGFRLAIVDRVVQEDRLQQDRFHVSDPESVATWIDWEGQCRVLARQVLYGDTMHDNSDMPLPPNYLRVHASNMVADADCVYSDIGNEVITSLISAVREQYCGDSGGFDIPIAQLRVSSLWCQNVCIKYVERRE